MYILITLCHSLKFVTSVGKIESGDLDKEMAKFGKLDWKRKHI